MKMNKERTDENMKKKNGFTLIELLAVIVILAIIALIAVPVVMNIIGKANKSAFKDSAYGLLKAGETYFTSELLKDAQGITEDKVFTFPNDIEGLEFKGSKPSRGTMTVRKDGKVSLAITNGKYCVTKGFEDEDVTISEGDCGTSNVGNTSKTLSTLATTYTFKKQVIATSTMTLPDGTASSTSTFIDEDEIINVPDCITNKTKCEAGTPVAVEVAPNTIYKFYVLNDDTTKNEVTLIMDRNLGEKVAWYKDNDDTTFNEKNNLGPITALNYLNTQTKNWYNIPAISDYEYSNTAGTYGYQKFEIVDGKGKLTSKDSSTVTEITGESKARLLTYEEATSTQVGCIEYQDRSCSNWIYGYLSWSTTYWLLSAYPSISTSGRCVNSLGSMGNDTVNSDYFNGVRPVITLSK